MRYGRYKSESQAYGAERDALLQAEIALRDQREAVAEMRRALPLDTEVDDYVFHETAGGAEHGASTRTVHLSELVGQDDKALVVYQFMYGGAQEKPCPMCTLWIDGYHGIAHHLRQGVNVAVIAEADCNELSAFARERGWTELRFLSSAGTTFKRDLAFENEAKEQFPGVSVFVLHDGSLRHSYSASAIMGSDQYRGMDLLNPLWHTLDLTPAGRLDDFWPRLSYGDDTTA